ncbi:MAG: cellulase family glycosylhydrolase [Bacteroidota bacterium]
MLGKTILFVLLGMLFLACGEEKEAAPPPEREVPASDEPMSFWNQQRKGTNYFNGTPTREWFLAAAEANIRLIRLTFEKWQGEERDFLMGDADDYQGLVEEDWLVLKRYLDLADSLDLNIVITPISLPGDRWRQSNDNQRDGRLWKQEAFRSAVLQYWTDLATRLKAQPAVVGYNLVNEPHPEVYYGKFDFWDEGFSEWYQSVQGGPGDLNRFNREVVAAIREVDSLMPIVVESGLFGTPWAFTYLKPLEDERIIYSFHMYEPYPYTTKRINQGRFGYPGNLFIEGLGDTFTMNRENLAAFFDPVRAWATQHQIPANRLWVGEFGCNRHVEGVEAYLRDLIQVFNEDEWHWSFYSYREDTWEAMDYELGTGRVPHRYWEYQENGSLHQHYPEIYRNRPGTFWDLFSQEFQP